MKNPRAMFGGILCENFEINREISEGSFGRFLEITPWEFLRVFHEMISEKM